MKAIPQKNRKYLLVLIALIFGGLFWVQGASAYNNGTFASQIEDSGQNNNSWGDFSWTTTQTANTQIVFKLRTSDSPTMEGAVDFSSCDALVTANQANSSGSVSLAGNNCVSVGDRYYQYQATFSSSNINEVAEIEDITISYGYYHSGAYVLESSPFNSTDLANVLGGVSWEENETLPENNETKMYLRAGTDITALLAASWTEVAYSSGSGISSGCTKNSGVVSCDNSVIPGSMKDETGDQYFQYKLELSSAGENTPAVTETEITYVVNAPPEVQNVSASQDSVGTVNLSYETRDSDTTSGSVTDGYVTPSFEYSLDGGSSWTSATEGCFSSGAWDNKAVNESTFTSYSATWDPSCEGGIGDSTYTPNAQIRVTVDDNEAANNTAGDDSSNFVLDTDPPAPGSPALVIDGTPEPAEITLSASDDTALEMQLGLASDLSGASWESYNSTTTLALSTSPETVYVRFRDAKGNQTSILNAATPPTPQNPMIQDTSNMNLDPPEYRLFLAWEALDNPPDPGFHSYNIYRSTDNVNFSKLAEITDMTLNYYGDSSVNASTTYYYKLSVKDDNDSESILSNSLYGLANGVQDAGEGGGGTEGTPPIISNVSAPTSTIYTTQATINWDTDELSDSLVAYSSNPGEFINQTGVGSLQDNSSNMGQHEVTLTSLAPSTTYYFYVRSIDNAGNIATSTQSPSGYTFVTDPGPTIPNVTVSEVTNHSAKINWTTDKPADSIVTYSENSDLTEPTRVEGSSDLVMNHEVEIEGLDQGTTYYYRVESTDADDYTAIDNHGGEYYDFTTTVDSQAPTITFTPTSSDISNITDTGARVSWVTSESATSSLEYGLDTNYASSTLTNDNYNTNHIFNLSGLTKGTTYYLRLKSTDVNYNTAIRANSNTDKFTTTDSTDYTAPAITFSSSTDITNITNTSARITWVTSESATSSLDYGEDQAYSSGTESNDYLNRNHIFDLSGLNKGTTYYIRFQSSDANGNTSTSTTASFTTTDTTDYDPPQIRFDPDSDITNITDTSAQISWTTDEVSTSSLSYGINQNYASSTRENNNLNTSHSYDLTGLAKGTNYYISFQNTDSNNNTSSSTTASFQTTDSTDYEDPFFSTAPNIDPLGDTYAVINWETDEDTDAQVNYGLAPGDYFTPPETSNEFDQSHSIILKGLTPNTNYYYYVESGDANGNSTSSREYSFTTMETLTEESDVEEREAEAREAGEESVSPGGGTIIIDKTDKEAPAISGIEAEDITTDSARISWETDEPSNSFLKYGVESNSYNNSKGDWEMTTQHLTTLEDLASNKTYYYKVGSQDSWGNLAQSQELSFKTLSLSEEQQEKLDEQTGGEEDDDSGLSFEDIENMTEAEKKKTAQELFDVASESTQKALKLLQNAQGEASLSDLEETLMLQYENIAQFADELPAPLLSGEPRVITTAKSAIIIWRTDKNSNSLIALAPENEYNSQADNPYTQVSGNPEERVTEHRVEINRLEPDTLYHYQLRSKGALGPEARSRDFTFRTQKEILEIRNYTVDKVSDQKATFKWTTNVEADTTIKYTPYRDSRLSVEEEQTKENQTVTTIHNMTLEGLEGGVNYEVELISSDLEGNTARRKLSSFSTTEDNYPPIIKQIETESAIAPGGRTQVQSIISWRTNELSTSRVYYTEGVVSPETKMDKETRLDDNYTKKHVVVLTDFEPGTPYSFRVESIDSSGNKTLSPVNTILAPQREESVFELIFKNLEGVFGWMREMR